MKNLTLLIRFTTRVLALARNTDRKLLARGCGCGCGCGSTAALGVVLAGDLASWHWGAGLIADGEKIAGVGDAFAIGGTADGFARVIGLTFAERGAIDVCQALRRNTSISDAFLGRSAVGVYGTLNAHAFAANVGETGEAITLGGAFLDRGALVVVAFARGNVALARRTIGQRAIGRVGGRVLSAVVRVGGAGGRRRKGRAAIRVSRALNGFAQIVGAIPLTFVAGASGSRGSLAVAGVVGRVLRAK